MDIKLTKDADALICLIYKEYLSRRKTGATRDKAKRTGGSKNIHDLIAPKLSIEDVEDICRELDRAGLLNCFYADNRVYDAYLSDVGIIYMENRFMAGITSVIEYLAKIKSIVPFI